MRDDLDRRRLLALGGLGGLGGLGLGAGLPALAQDAGTEGETEAERIARIMAPPENPLKTIMLIHPRMILLDLVAPLTVMNILRAENHLAWKTDEPVSTDVGLPVAPTTTFEDCPEEADLLFVPGGIMGTIAMMRDEAVLDFLVAKAARARLVTSVCTGGLVLGAAGLLEGYEATTHWAVADLLPLLGARHRDERVVEDRNRVTGAGATAGMDLALTLAARLYGEEEARRVQLILEYAPEPPFANGTPTEAGTQRLATARERRVWMDAEARRAAEASARRLAR